MGARCERGLGGLSEETVASGTYLLVLTLNISKCCSAVYGDLWPLSIDWRN